MTFTRFQAARALLGALALMLALALALAPRAGAVLVHFGPHNRSVVGVLPRRGIAPRSIPGHFAPAGHASAVRASSASGSAVSAFSASAPCPQGAPPEGTLIYRCGPILHAERIYLIFWDPGNQITPSEQNLFEQYFHDTAANSGLSTNVFGVLRQYTDATGFADYKQTWSGAQALTDSNPYPAGSNPGRADCPNNSQASLGTDVPESNCLTDAQIQTELQRFVSADGLPTGTSGIAPIYVVITPPLVNTCADSATCSDNVYCAYHGATTTNPSPATILYADMPTLSDEYGTKGCQFDGNAAIQEPNPAADTGFVTDVALSSLSHEISETITDPLSGSGYVAASGAEAGDECASTGAFDPAANDNPDAFLPVLGGDPNMGTAFNQIIAGDHYYTQTEWSNGNLGCQAQPVVVALNIGFTVSGQPRVNRPLSFSPSSSAQAGFSSITWNFGDGFSSFATGAPVAVTHTYAAPGNFIVTETVVDAGGQISTVSQTIKISAPVAAFTVLGATHVAKLPVTLDARGSTDSGATINSYSWSFGDGSRDTTSGARPRHAFPRPGAYTVTLTVGDIAGQTSTATRAVVVASPSITATTVRTGRTVETLRVAVSGAGTLSTGKTRVKVRRDGTVTLKIALSAGQRRTLSGHHKLTVKLTLRFVPSVGRASSRQVEFTVRG